MDGPPESKSDWLVHFGRFRVPCLQSKANSIPRVEKRASRRIARVTRPKCQLARATAGTRRRNWSMGDQSETFARHLVRALYYATDGRARWWLLPANLNDVTNEALAVAVERGWMLMDRGHSVCLTDAGRDLVRSGPPTE